MGGGPCRDMAWLGLARMSPWGDMGDLIRHCSQIRAILTAQCLEKSDELEMDREASGNVNAPKTLG